MTSKQLRWGESGFIRGTQINLISWHYGLFISINSRVKFSFETPIRVGFIRFYRFELRKVTQCLNDQLPFLNGVGGCIIKGFFSPFLYFL
jgi:hypothetical protein